MGNPVNHVRSPDRSEMAPHGTEGRARRDDFLGKAKGGRDGAHAGALPHRSGGQRHAVTIAVTIILCCVVRLEAAAVVAIAGVTIATHAVLFIVGCLAV